jgi:deoxyribonuclease V
MNAVSFHHNNGDVGILDSTNKLANGYSISVDKDGVVQCFIADDMGVELERTYINKSGDIHNTESLGLKLGDTDIDRILFENSDVMYTVREIEKMGENVQYSIGYFYENDPKEKQRARKTVWAYLRKKNMEKGLYANPDDDFVPYYIQQQELQKQVITEDRLPESVKFIAGVDVAYNQSEQKLVGGIVVVDISSLDVVDKAYHEMEVTFPYVPGLFPFREVPPLLEAYKKLSIKPELIICDGHGTSHPKGAGMASHLGLELNIPTIGCANTRLIGEYAPPVEARGSWSSLKLGDIAVGRVLKTQERMKPVFVSVGHKISIETACNWILNLSLNDRLPEIIKNANSLVNDLIKQRTTFDFPE